MSAKDFLLKLCRQRAATIRLGVCGKDVRVESETLKRVESWLNFWNPNDEQCKKFIEKNQLDIMTLMPGGKHYKSWMDKLNTLLNHG